MTSHSGNCFSFVVTLSRGKCAGKARGSSGSMWVLRRCTDKRDSGWMVLKAAITSCQAHPLRLQEPPRAHLIEAADSLLCPPNLNMWIFFGD